MWRSPARWKGVAVTMIALSGSAATPAWAAQAGTNYCVHQGHTVYRSATFNADPAGWMPYAGVWHHYSTHGNWSLGYVRDGGPSGYVPLGILAQDLGNSSTATQCPYH